MVDMEGERVERREGVVKGVADPEKEAEVESEGVIEGEEERVAKDAEGVKDGRDGEEEGLKVDDSELVIEYEVETVPEREAVQLIGYAKPSPMQQVQGVQEVLFSYEYVPLGHIVQLACPVEAKYPAGQG